MPQSLQDIVNSGPRISEAYDASNKAAQQYFTVVKNWLKEKAYSVEQAEKEVAESDKASIAFRTMLKFIKSEQIIMAIRKPVFVTLINPVYKEKGRMSRREEHPHGENSLRTKIDTLNYFHSLNANFKGRVLVVDDECPEGSGEMAEDILREYPHDNHEVVYLGRAIKEKDPDLPVGITAKSGQNRSVKGGSVLLGMQKAISKSYSGRHIIIDNDADLSIHPRQIGLVMDDILSGRAVAVAGSRREDDSVALIGSGRNQRGELFINIWQSLLPHLANIVTDTNRAFKAFDSKALAQIIRQIKIYTFPYQIELLQACISNNIPLMKRGIAYLDSEAASTQSGANITETYLNQIHQIIDIARRYQTIGMDSPAVQYFLSISEDKWREIEANPPERLSELYS
jgi:hypothetical protein